ncbi:MAG: hypothetical protein VX259_09045, partial [Pseudomonadota bacterium]|nr:hypothetical protein [Pseudomonadota bacterium]
STLQLALGSSPIVVAALSAVTLNLVLPQTSLADEQAERQRMAARMDAQDAASPGHTEEVPSVSAR